MGLPFFVAGLLGPLRRRAASRSALTSAPPQSNVLAAAPIV